MYFLLIVGVRVLAGQYPQYTYHPQFFASPLPHPAASLPNLPQHSYVSEYDVQNILSGFREELHKKSKTDGTQ